MKKFLMFILIALSVAITLSSCSKVTDKTLSAKWRVESARAFNSEYGQWVEATDFTNSTVNLRNDGSYHWSFLNGDVYTGNWSYVSSSNELIMDYDIWHIVYYERKELKLQATYEGVRLEMYWRKI
jgi:hypothetical protein